MPPSLRLSVGVPLVVLTVTGSLQLTVSVTTWPVLRLPLPLVIPGPEVTIAGCPATGDPPAYSYVADAGPADATTPGPDGTGTDLGPAPLSAGEVRF